MNRMKPGTYLLALLLCVSAYSAAGKEVRESSIYFNLDDGVVEEFKGTCIFKYKKIGLSSCKAEPVSCCVEQPYDW
jgi:hypothetical protein